MAIYGNMVVPSKAAGGALPTDNSDRNIYVPGSEVSGRFSDAGGVAAMQGAQKAAEGLKDFGKGLGALGSMGLTLYTRQRRIEHAEAMEAVSRLQTEYIEKQREWSQIKGANAINMEELKSRWWDEAMPRLTQGLSDYGKRYFNLNADRVGAQADTFIQNHQEREIKGYEDQQFKLAMDAEGNQIAANINDPAAVNASLGRLRALWDRQCLRDGTPDDAREAGWRAMVGKAMSNAIGVRISMGDLDGAQRLIMQYGGNISPEDYAKLRQSWASGQMSELAGLAGAGKVDAIRQRLNAGGAVTLQQRLSQAAVMKIGEKYTWGNNDCSGHTCQVWQATLGESPAKTAIFGKDGEHVTAAEIMRRASGYTKQLYSGAQINSESVKGGWLLASTSRSPNGRWHNIHHVVTTVEQPDGSIWVSEALGGPNKNGQVQLVPLDKFLMRYQGRTLFGVDLSSLQPGQGGAQSFVQGVPAGWVEYTGKDRGNSLPERQHNPGAVKPPSGYSTFSSDAEGFLAQAKVLRTDKYYAGKNIKDLVLTYVGYNPPQSYWAKIKEQGFRLDEVPNRSDNRVLSRLMVALARGESPLGKHYEPEQVEALLNGSAQGQPQGQGFQLTQAERQRAENDYVPMAAANGIVDAARTDGGSMAQIKAKSFGMLESMPAGERDKLRPMVERRLADLEQNQLAQDGVLYEETIKTLSGMNSRDRDSFITQMTASGKASPELIKKVTTWNSGVKAVEKESGERWASDMRGRMDDYYVKTKTSSEALEKEVRVKQMRGEITDDTAQKLMEWSRTGGSRKNFTQETLKELYNEGKPKAEWEDPPEDLVQRLWAQMRNAGDKPVGKDEIREMMRREMLPTTTPYPGMIPFKKTTEVPYHQAASEGRKVIGVTPNPEQIPGLKREMEELARRRPKEFTLDPNKPEDINKYYAGKLGGKW